jgi:thioredoxin 2
MTAVADEKVHVVCAHCNSINRVPGDRLGQGPKCGKCGNVLFEAKPFELTTAAFNLQIEKSDIPLVVDFWASWCAPCRMMAPEFEKAAASLEPEARFAKVDTESEQGLAARYNIRGIPTMIVFKGGRELARQSGAMPAKQIEQFVRGTL